MGIIMKDGRTREYLMTKYGITEESLANDIANLKKWLQREQYFPHVKHICSDKWLENQILMVKNNLQKAKVSIELYIEAREKCPRIFQGRDVSNQDLKECFKVVTLSTLPGVTPLGYCASIVRFEDVDWNKFNVEALLKRLMMVMEYFLKEGLDFSGFHVVLDLANLKFGHLKKFNIEIMKTIKILMKAYPVSFSRISLINYPQFIQKGIAIFKPFLSEKLMQRIKLHNNLFSLYEEIPPASLPSDYNGELKDQKYWSDLWLQRFASIRSHIKECDNIRYTKPKTVDINSYIGTFKKLEID